MIQLYYIDACLPDFFTGFPVKDNQVIIQIPVDGDTTADQFIEGVVEAYNFDGAYEKVEAEDGELIDAANRLLTVIGTDLVFPELDRESYDDDYIDTIYCYLLMEKV